jgi:hypothetical protein
MVMPSDWHRGLHRLWGVLSILRGAAVIAEVVDLYDNLKLASGVRRHFSTALGSKMLIALW